jgi:hypothetical protein
MLDVFWASRIYSLPIDINLEGGSFGAVSNIYFDTFFFFWHFQ